MKKIIIVMVASILAWQPSALAKEKIAEKSDHIQYGVRLYRGSLPIGVDYTIIGPVEFHQGIGSHKQGMDMLLANARLKGANAVINARTKKDKYIGDAVHINTFPDVYIEEDFEKFKGQKEYEKSETLDFPIGSVFNTIAISLEQDLEEFLQLDMEKGIIETKPMEVSNGMTDGLSPGPYPVRKILINLIPLDKDKTEVTIKYEYLKGRPWSRLFLQNNSNKFFKSIKTKLINDMKGGKNIFKPVEELGLDKSAKIVAGKSCTVHARLILDKVLAEQYVGFDPLRTQLIPVYCKINAQEPITISLDDVQLVDAEDNVYEPDTVYNVIEKIKNKASKGNAGNYAAFGLGGMVGGLLTESIGGGGIVDQSFMAIVKYELQKRYFESCQIDKGASEQGAFIFNVPKEVIKIQPNYNLILTVRNADNAIVEKIELPLD